MNNQILSFLKLITVLAVVSIFANKFLEVYKTFVRNQAIDGCYNQSFYQVQRTEKTQIITTSETQKYIYTKCLLDKNIR